MLGSALDCSCSCMVRSSSEGTESMPAADTVQLAENPKAACTQVCIGRDECSTLVTRIYPSVLTTWPVKPVPMTGCWGCPV